MNFEDRLKSQMQNQSNEIDIVTEGVGSIAARSKRNSQRRTAGMVMAAVLCIAGVGAFVTNRADESELALTNEDVTSSTTTPSNESAGVDGNGEGFQLVDISSEFSPNGFNLQTQTVDGDGLYYVLSTAPGKTFEEYYEEGENYYGDSPDTLYVWTGSEWKVKPIEGHKPFQLVSSEGVLYTLSSGTTSGQELALGTSTDQGDSWNWTTLDTGSEGGTPFGFNAKLDADNGRALVGVSHTPYIDYEEASKLARDAGAEIGVNGEIGHANSSGIFIYEDTPFEMGPCATASSDFLNEKYAGIETPGDVYEGLEEGQEPTPEQLAKIEEWEDEMMAINQQINAELVDHLRGIEGCGEFAVCNQQQDEVGQRTWGELERLHDEGASSEELEKAEQAADAAYTEWHETSGCGEVLNDGIDHGIDTDGDDEPEFMGPEFLSWADLGVTVPESWKPTFSGYIIENGEVTELAEVPAPNGYLQAVEIDSSGMTAKYQGDGFANSEALLISADLKSVDGVNWTTTPGTDTGYLIEKPTAGGFSFDITWTQEGSKLMRFDASGNAEEMTLDQLAPGLDAEGYEIYIADSGPFGVVVAAQKFVEGEDYEVDSIVLHSTDGVSWGATTLPGLSVYELMVGTDNAMIFAANHEIANSDTPQPVYMATLN